MNVSAVTIPLRVAQIIETWVQFQEAANGYTARLAQIRDKNNEVLGVVDPNSSYCDFVWEGVPDVANVARTFVRALVCEAVLELSPAGAKIDIPADGVVGKFHYDLDDPSSFSPHAVWDYLVSTYSPELAYQQQAVLLRRAFRELYERNAGQPVKRVGGCPVLTATTFACSYDSSCYSYNSQEEIRKAIVALGAVLGWSGMLGRETINTALQEGIEALVRSGKELPERRNITAEILAVPFLSKIEFRISERLFSHLLLFMAEFGPRGEE